MVFQFIVARIACVIFPAFRTKQCSYVKLCVIVCTPSCFIKSDSVNLYVFLLYQIVFRQAIL